MGLVPFVCEVLRSARRRARSEVPDAGHRPQFGAAINRSIIAERTSAHHGSLRNHGQGARLHGRINHARPRSLPPNQRPPCGDMHLVWLLIGKELGDQLSKRRGVRLEGLGDIILTVDGIRLVKGGNLRGARPAHPLNLAAIAKAANARGVCSSAASRWCGKDGKGCHIRIDAPRE